MARPRKSSNNNLTQVLTAACAGTGFRGLGAGSGPPGLHGRCVYGALLVRWAGGSAWRARCCGRMDSVRELGPSPAKRPTPRFRPEDGVVMGEGSGWAPGAKREGARHLGVGGRLRRAPDMGGRQRTQRAGRYGGGPARSPSCPRNPLRPNEPAHPPSPHRSEPFLP